jgi:gluconolactonase
MFPSRPGLTLPGLSLPGLTLPGLAAGRLLRLFCTGLPLAACNKTGKREETMTELSDILQTTTLERVATGFVFTEGPLWHPDGFFYFVDVRTSQLYRVVLGKTPELVRKTVGGNGTTFDLQGRLINCEGDGRRVTRAEPGGHVITLLDRIEDKRLNRPNDVICASDGSLYFTDPSLRVPLADREIEQAAVYRIAPDGGVFAVASFEYPNGLALSPDERTLYVANTRWAQYIHAIELDAGGNMLRRRIFADMSADGTNGVPDGMKVDAQGRVFCTGTGGVWVFEPDGTRIGIIETPEVCANIAFGGADLRTLLLTASTSVYTLRTKAPGLPHPWYRIRST